MTFKRERQKYNKYFENDEEREKESEIWRNRVTEIKREKANVYI